MTYTWHITSGDLAGTAKILATSGKVFGENGTNVHHHPFLFLSGFFSKLFFQIVLFVMPRQKRGKYCLLSEEKPWVFFGVEERLGSHNTHTLEFYLCVIDGTATLCCDGDRGTL